MAFRMPREDEAAPPSSRVPSGRMRVACAWCGLDMGGIESDPAYSDRTSHGICADCLRNLGREPLSSGAALPARNAGSRPTRR